MKRLIWVFLVALIILRYSVTRPIYKDGQHLRVTAKVSSEPLRFNDSQRLIIAGLKTYIPLYPEVIYGDVVVIEGLVKTGTLTNPKLISVSPSQGVIYKLRERLLKFYKSNIPEPHASLVAGMTVGSRSGIPKDIWEDLKESGTAHVVVASGMNVTLVAGFLLGILVGRIPRRKAVPLAIIGVWFYAIFSGFEAPIVRAVIMSTFALTAQELGRVNFALRTLFFSAGFMLLVNPNWLIDLGFILSFVATFSLIIFGKRIEKKLKRVPSFVREDLSTTLAAQIGVVPILYFTFGQFNPLSPLANVLVLWTVVPITMIGMIAGALGLIFEPLGRFVLLLIYPLTSWFLWVIRIFT